MIRMIAGVYGMKVKRSDGSTYTKGMGVWDGSFSLDPEMEAELVKKGVARYVSEPAPIPPSEDTEPDSSTEPSEVPKLPDGVEGIPQYSVNDTVAALRKIGDMCGLTFKVGMSKQEMVAAIDAHIAENTAENPEAVTEDVETAPRFDAAEAVQ